MIFFLVSFAFECEYIQYSFQIYFLFFSLSMISDRKLFKEHFNLQAPNDTADSNRTLHINQNNC